MFFSFRSMHSSLLKTKEKCILALISDSYYSLIWYLGARNIKLSIIESYCLWYPYLNSALIMTNGIRKVRLRQKNSWFLYVYPGHSASEYGLQQSFPCIRQNMNQLSGFYFLCFHLHCFCQEGRGTERERNPSSALSFLYFQAGCTETAKKVLGKKFPEKKS